MRNKETGNGNDATARVEGVRLPFRDSATNLACFSGLMASHRARHASHRATWSVNRGRVHCRLDTMWGTRFMVAAGRVTAPREE
jgi:hypothetical protein